MFLCGLLLILIPSLLWAQGYPTKPINILNYLNFAPIDGALEENSGLTTREPLYSWVKESNKATKNK
jgi:hypothetical protein